MLMILLILMAYRTVKDHAKSEWMLYWCSC